MALRVLLLLSLPFVSLAQPFSAKEIAGWQKQATRVTIMRDTWGIAHVYGKTDADAVFGFLYAQCEDDFERVEMNYINAVARLAEVEGESKIYHDLRMRLFYDTLEAQNYYQKADPWLRQLCDAFAAGINYYLHTHPQVKPKLLKRFQPWMPFLFSEGSIGTDIESISVNQLKAFYGEGKTSALREEEDHNKPEPEPRGSNGFAIAPARSASGKAMLMINPHTSFYFRPEIHINSNEGLNAYGAVTWGQFFIYQGFNSYCGWMHTSSQADAIDHYRETILKKDNRFFYRYGNEERPVQAKSIRLAYRDGNTTRYREFTAYYTHHGPVIEGTGNQWTTISLMKEPVKALTQSYMRTKAKGLKDFQQTMALRTNSSNNTVYADRDGNIAYWHGNFIPRRDGSFDWEKPVDGSNPATEWKGLHEVGETVHLLNPANGWIQNCNSTPFTAAGPASPDRTRYARYLAPDFENARGLNAVRVMNRQEPFTLDQLIAAAYDSYLTAFETLVPALLQAYDRYAPQHPETKAQLDAPIAALRTWNFRHDIASVPTTLATYWGQELRQRVLAKGPIEGGQLGIITAMANQTSDEEKVKALADMVNELERDYGTWQVAWGEVNRFQRLTGNINEVFDDNKPSLAVPYSSSFWGSLAAFGSRKFPGTKKMYGYVGNSFVAAVEFGERIKAKSVLAGGVNRDPASPYFTNQAENYSRGHFKDVLFYREDVQRHAVRTYQPGQ
jgi:acyl-homoserine lactone acylase PvdQ